MRSRPDPAAHRAVPGRFVRAGRRASPDASFILSALVPSLALLLAAHASLAADNVLTLRRPGAATTDYLGWSVATLGDDVLVGVPRAEGSTGTVDAGAAYLFDGTTGAVLATFRSDTPTGGAVLGWSVAGAGDEALVGAPDDLLDTPAGAAVGAAYVFRRDGTQRLRLKSPDPHSFDEFGWSVAFVGSFFVVGAPKDDVANRLPSVTCLQVLGTCDNAGAVYIFDGATGELQTRLL